IPETVVGDSDAGIEVLHRRVGRENVGHALERSKRRIDERVERVNVGGGIGDKLIAEADVKGQLGKRLPLIVDISIQFNFAKVTIGVREPWLGPLEKAWGALQKSGQAGESIEAAPPSLLLEIALNAAEGCTKPKA